MLAELPASLARRLTHKEARYVAARVRGLCKRDAMRAAGLPDHLYGERDIERDAVESAIAETSTLLTDAALQVGLADAAELHEHLSDALRGDISELYKDDQLLPIAEWPAWARVSGVVEIIDEPDVRRSEDGTGAGWDVVGRRRRVRMTSKRHIVEMLARLKAVDALAANKLDVNVDVQARVADVQRARRRAARVIDVQSAPSIDDRPQHLVGSAAGESAGTQVADSTSDTPHIMTVMRHSHSDGSVMADTPGGSKDAAPEGVGGTVTSPSQANIEGATKKNEKSVGVGDKFQLRSEEELPVLESPRRRRIREEREAELAAKKLKSRKGR